MPAVFIVDDDTDMLTSLESFFKKKNFGVKTFSNGHYLLDAIRQDKPELILLDINLVNEDGRSICYDIKTSASTDVKVLLISADPIALLNYEYSYADGIVNKPFAFAELERKCDNLLIRKRTWLD